MPKLVLLTLAVFLVSCSSTEQNARTLLDRLEFEEGETGCVRLNANIDLNPLPLITSAASLSYRKQVGEGEFTC